MNSIAITPTTAVEFLLEANLYNRLYKEPDAEVINKAGSIYFKFSDNSIGYVGKLEFSYRKVSNWNIKEKKVILYLVL
jgi:hypothetical protein